MENAQDMLNRYRLQVGDVLIFSRNSDGQYFVCGRKGTKEDLSRCVGAPAAMARGRPAAGSKEFLPMVSAGTRALDPGMCRFGCEGWPCPRHVAMPGRPLHAQRARAPATTWKRRCRHAVRANPQFPRRRPRGGVAASLPSPAHARSDPRRKTAAKRLSEAAAARRQSKAAKPMPQDVPKAKRPKVKQVAATQVRSWAAPKPLCWAAGFEEGGWEGPAREECGPICSSAPCQMRRAAEPRRGLLGRLLAAQPQGRRVPRHAQWLHA